MSTRSTTHFVYGDEDKPEAIVYRHSDGYPEGAGADILEFLAEVGKLKDPRFGDPSYLAAKYVVFLADKFNNGYTGNGEWKRNESKLDFLSVGVMREDPLDIEYRYVIDCKTVTNPYPTAGQKVKPPKVTCYAVNERDGVWTKEKVSIPKPKKAKPEATPA